MFRALLDCFLAEQALPANGKRISNPHTTRVNLTHPSSHFHLNPTRPICTTLHFILIPYAFIIIRKNTLRQLGETAGITVSSSLSISHTNNLLLIPFRYLIIQLTVPYFIPVLLSFSFLFVSLT